MVYVTNRTYPLVGAPRVLDIGGAGRGAGVPRPRETLREVRVLGDSQRLDVLVQRTLSYVRT